MKPKRHGMTKRQADFAAAYLRTGNASEAARAAGYHGEYTAQAGRRFLSKKVIKDYITEKLKAVEEAEAIDIPRFVKTELLEVANGPQVYEDSGPKGGTSTKINTSKLKALELLAKISGMQVEKPVQVDLTINMSDEQKAIIEKHGLAKRTE